LAGNVAVEAPKIGFIIGYLFAKLAAGFLVFLDAVDFVGVKADGQNGF
jgi:hypothetical protein